MDAVRTDWHSLHGTAFEGSRVLVTGGAGFIGSHLSAALSTLGATVIVIDDLAGGDKANLAGIENVTFHEGTILDLDLLNNATAGCQYVFHQAALGSVPRSVEQPRRYHDANVTGTFNVLEAARSAGVERVMFAASSSAYGDTEQLPKTESMPPRPLSPYAANKVADEAMMSAYAHSLNLDTASLRYFNIFGPRQSATNAYAAVIAAFAKALLGFQRPAIYGDGEQSRDFTFVDNAVHANLLAARREQPIKGAVMNIACGDRVSVNQLATDMAALLQRPDLVPIYHPDRAGDVKHSQADLSVAKQLIGYTPIVPFAAGLAATVKWYQQAGV